MAESNDILIDSVQALHRELFRIGAPRDWVIDAIPDKLGPWGIVKVFNDERLRWLKGLFVIQPPRSAARFQIWEHDRGPKLVREYATLSEACTYVFETILEGRGRVWHPMHKVGEHSDL